MNSNPVTHLCFNSPEMQLRITNLEGVTWTFKTNFEPKEFVKITNE